MTLVRIQIKQAFKHSINSQANLFFGRISSENFRKMSGNFFWCKSIKSTYLNGEENAWTFEREKSVELKNQNFNQRLHLYYTVWKIFYHIYFTWNQVSIPKFRALANYQNSGFWDARFVSINFTEYLSDRKILNSFTLFHIFFFNC